MVIHDGGEMVCVDRIPTKNDEITWIRNQGFRLRSLDAIFKTNGRQGGSDSECGLSRREHKISIATLSGTRP
jgi:hypothetical protein